MVLQLGDHIYAYIDIVGAVQKRQRLSVHRACTLTSPENPGLIYAYYLTYIHM